MGLGDEQAHKLSEELGQLTDLMPQLAVFGGLHSGANWLKGKVGIDNINPIQAQIDARMKKAPTKPPEIRELVKTLNRRPPIHLN